MTGTVERACTVTPRHRHKERQADEKNSPDAPSVFPRAEEPSKSPNPPPAVPFLPAPPCVPSLWQYVPGLIPQHQVLGGGVKAGQKGSHSTGTN